MNEKVMTYAMYLALAVPVTIWVARTLYRNGRVFLVRCFKGDEELANSVNHLLVVGFYLVNLGFVAMYLRLDRPVEQVTGVFEAVSAKIGIVLLVLGAMHFLNMFVFAKIRGNRCGGPQCRRVTNEPPPLAKHG